MEILIELTEDQLQKVSGVADRLADKAVLAMVKVPDTVAVVPDAVTESGPNVTLPEPFSSSSTLQPEAHLLWGTARGIRAAFRWCIPLPHAPGS